MKVITARVHSLLCTGINELHLIQWVKIIEMGKIEKAGK